MKKPLRTCPVQFCKNSYHCMLSKNSSNVVVFENQISGVKETSCPFAPKAVGNICTDDFVYMLQSMGYETGIALEKLINTSKWLEEKLGRTLEGMYMKTID